jgi:hypothetical protein
VEWKKEKEKKKREMKKDKTAPHEPAAAKLAEVPDLEAAVVAAAGDEERDRAGPRDDIDVVGVRALARERGPAALARVPHAHRAVDAAARKHIGLGRRPLDVLDRRRVARKRPQVRRPLAAGPRVVHVDVPRAVARREPPGDRRRPVQRKALGRVRGQRRDRLDRLGEVHRRLGAEREKIKKKRERDKKNTILNKGR